MGRMGVLVMIDQTRQEQEQGKGGKSEAISALSFRLHLGRLSQLRGKWTLPTPVRKVAVRMITPAPT